MPSKPLAPTDVLPLLTLQFFGGVDLRHDRAPVTGFATQKALALFIYLAVTRQPHTRDHLATLLWSNLDDKGARRALRFALWNLRQILAPYLKITRHTIAFNTDASHTSDVETFGARAALLQTFETLTPETVENLRGAVELYRGEFLQGFHVRDTEEFEAWLLLMRERFHRTILEVLRQLVAYETEQQSFVSGIEYARRWLELEPWSEDAHRALMKLYAWNGDTPGALAQFEACRRILAAELKAEPDASTVVLANAIQQGNFVLPAQKPKARALQNNLPTTLTPFFGRETEIQRIREKLREPTCRLVTLTGEGGIGKTRLALETAAQLIDAFADGVWFVPLSDAEIKREEISHVLANAIARAVGLTPNPTLPLVEQLAAYLRERELLLVLDNFEHFLSASAADRQDDTEPTRASDTNGAAWVSELLATAPHVHLLVTSRARLNLHSEFVMRLDGLAVPNEVALAAAYSSVQLFLERAERVGAQPDELDMAQVVRICQLVEGLPLAIELAASWMNRVTPAEMLQALQNDLEHITLTQQDMPSRHRTLRAVFENSWRLLSPAEQIALAQVSIFRHTFTRHAAVTIIDLGQQPRNESRPPISNVPDAVISQVVDSLADKSLLRRIARPDATSQRFRLHPLTRQFAYEMITTQTNDVARRHALYFLEFVAARSERLFGQETRRAFIEIQEDLQNIRAAWDWGVAHHANDALAAALDATAAFYEFAGLAEEGLLIIERAIHALEADTPISQRLVLRFQLARAKLLLRTHRHREAQVLAERVLKQATEIQDRELIAWGRYVRGIGLSRLPDTALELAELEQARTEAHSIDQTRLEALCLLRLGMVAMRAGEYRTAKDYSRQALELFETLQDIRFEGASLAMLGLIEFTLGEFPDAVKSQTRAIEIADHIGDGYLKAVTLHNLGNTLASQGHYEQALASMEQSEKIHRDVGSPLAIGSQAQMGLFLTVLGNWMEARRTLEPLASSKFEQRREFGWANRGLALLARRQGQLVDAIRFARLALETARQWDDINDQAEAGIALADALFEQGALQEAEETYRLVLTLREKMHQPHLLPDAMAGLANVALSRGATETARQWIEKIWRGKDLRMPAGPDEPFWIYWTGYQVMCALNDPRAGRLLETAQMILAEYASQITDPYTHERFLQVPWHRAILRANEPLHSLPLFVVSGDTELRH